MTQLDVLATNTLRLLAVDAVERAQSGHPGLPLGAAPAMHILWTRHLRLWGGAPLWPNRDRFVLSAGHGSALLYALLHLAGFRLSLQDLKQFRQLHARTPGHPEAGATEGVEATTGPLGQGFANAVGMAMAERVLAHQYNRPGLPLVDHCTYALLSDGDMMEGIVAEAASLAGHLGLGKLTAIYDANGISLDGPCSLCFTEDVATRWRACGWEVVHVDAADTDFVNIDAAIAQARACSTRPSLLIMHTTIGFGAPTKQGRSASHGSPLGHEELRRTKATLGFDPDRYFIVPDVVRALWEETAAKGRAAVDAWQRTTAQWRADYPTLAARWDDAQKHVVPHDLASHLPRYTPGRPLATRAASGEALNAAAAHMPSLLGGDADLSVSTLTSVAKSPDFCGRTGQGGNVRFGVREHAMGGILNGMAYHGGLHPYGATFLVFSDYLRPALRLAALGGLRVTYVFTHDSIGVGEDGPTHQPIEHLMALRAMPNLVVLRPADANETVQAWGAALAHPGGPVALVLARQKVPILDRSALGCSPVAQNEGVGRGAYVLRPAPGPIQGLFVATGSEVHLALEAAALLEADGLMVAVVSMPSWELFCRQSAAYHREVLPPQVRARVSIEAGSTLGWHRWVGDLGAVMGLDTFGLSGPAEQVFAARGLTAAHAALTMRRVVAAAAMSTQKTGTQLAHHAKAIPKFG